MAKKKNAPRDTASQRQAKVEALRREQARADRRRGLAIWGSLAAALLVIAGAVGFAILRERGNTPTLSGVQSYTYDAGKHTDQQVDYAEHPPVGGEHAGAWLNCGVYDQAVPNENAVHSLEHGAVWVTYDPDLADADVAKLREAIPGTYMLLSPMEDLPSPVVASAWGKQLSLTGADDARLAEFIKEYRQGPQTPEPGAACTGGVDAPGRVA